MCTTALLLGTLVMMLRRHFFNKVEPYVLSCPVPGGPGLGLGGSPGVEDLPTRRKTHPWRYLVSYWFWSSGPGDIPLCWAKGILH